MWASSFVDCGLVLKILAGTSFSNTSAHYSGWFSTPRADLESCLPIEEEEKFQDMTDTIVEQKEFDHFPSLLIDYLHHISCLIFGAS